MAITSPIMQPEARCNNNPATIMLTEYSCDCVIATMTMLEGRTIWYYMSNKKIDQVKILIRIRTYCYHTVMEYNKMCKDILNLDPKIRFTGICDETGETNYGGQREGVQNLLSLDETKRSNLQALARWGLRNALASKIGKGRYAMAEYEKVKRITIPLENNHLLLITTEVEADHGRIIGNVLKLIQRPDQG